MNWLEMGLKLTALGWKEPVFIISLAAMGLVGFSLYVLLKIVVKIVEHLKIE